MARTVSLTGIAKRAVAFFCGAFTDDSPIRFSVLIRAQGYASAVKALTYLPWQSPRLRLLMCDIAERALPHFEARRPRDKRPRACIEVARRFAKGCATEEELFAARREAAQAAECSPTQFINPSQSWDDGNIVKSAAQAAERCGERCVGFSTWNIINSVENTSVQAAVPLCEGARFKPCEHNICLCKKYRDAERKATLNLIIKHFG